MLQILRLFEARRVDEADDFEVELAICQERALAVVFCEGDELESSLEIVHVEVGQGDAAEAIEPSCVQLDAFPEPKDRAVVFL